MTLPLPSLPMQVRDMPNLEILRTLPVVQASALFEPDQTCLWQDLAHGAARDLLTIS